MHAFANAAVEGWHSGRAVTVGGCFYVHTTGWHSAALALEHIVTA